MSWTDFAHMIDAGAGATTAEWQNAINGNPNTPADALKVAVLNRIVDPKDTAALERLCALVIELAERTIDRTKYARQYHDAAKRLAGEKATLLSAAQEAYDWLDRFGEHAPIVFGGEAEVSGSLYEAIQMATAVGAAAPGQED